MPVRRIKCLEEVHATNFLDLNVMNDTIFVLKRKLVEKLHELMEEENDFWKMFFGPTKE